ncbi:EthD domain-containing protein [Frankia canadensis]|nr:EthD domain-containing protein [Frankia canadensis]
MLHSPDDVSQEQFFAALTSRRPRLEELAGSLDLAVRIGVRHPEEHSGGNGAGSAEGVEGAAEFSTPADRLDDLRAAAGAIGALLTDIVDTRNSIVLVGPGYETIEPRAAYTFLSLTFQRVPGTTLEQMRTWWRDQHGPLASGLLAPELLAYDQVHVEPELSELASRDAGFAYRAFDSYDNLTWTDYADFLRSVSKPGTGEALAQDEQGHLDRATFVGGMMQRV